MTIVARYQKCQILLPNERLVLVVPVGNPGSGLNDPYIIPGKSIAKYLFKIDHTGFYVISSGRTSYEIVGNSIVSNTECDPSPALTPYALPF